MEMAFVTTQQLRKTEKFIKLRRLISIKLEEMIILFTLRSIPKQMFQVTIFYQIESFRGDYSGPQCQDYYLSDLRWESRTCILPDSLFMQHS